MNWRQLTCVYPLRSAGIGAAHRHPRVRPGCCALSTRTQSVITLVTPASPVSEVTVIFQQTLRVGLCRNGAAPQANDSAQTTTTVEIPTEISGSHRYHPRLRRHREIPSIQHRNPPARSNTPPRDPRRGDGSPARPGRIAQRWGCPASHHAASPPQVALSRLTRILLLVAVALCLGAPAAAAVPVKKLDNNLGEMWTTILQTPKAQNPFFTGGGCYNLGGTVAPFGAAG